MTQYRTALRDRKSWLESRAATPDFANGEGYALGTPALCRRHLRIAMGSAAEAECLTRLAGELGYLADDLVKHAEQSLGDTMRALHGLLRNPPTHRT